MTTEVWVRISSFNMLKTTFSFMLMDDLPWEKHLFICIFYFSVYNCCGYLDCGLTKFDLFSAFFVLLYAIVCAFSMVIASRKLHGSMLMNILRSPMSFFDTTPIGRIVNRFSRDMETVDNVLPQIFRSWMNTFFQVISTIVVVSYSTPLFLAMVVPLTIVYYFIQVTYSSQTKKR